MNPDQKQMVELLKKLNRDIDDLAVRKEFFENLNILQAENPEAARRFEDAFIKIHDRSIRRDWKNPPAKMLSLYKRLKENINDEQALMQFSRGLVVLRDLNPNSPTTKNFARAYFELVDRINKAKEPVKIKLKPKKPTRRLR